MTHLVGSCWGLRTTLPVLDRVNALGARRNGFLDRWGPCHVYTGLELRAWAWNKSCSDQLLDRNQHDPQPPSLLGCGPQIISSQLGLAGGALPTCTLYLSTFPLLDSVPLTPSLSRL